MPLSIVLLIAGFVLLVKGADWLVSGASAMARAYGVSDLVIGLSIVAFGTSFPELAISLLASLHGNAEICVANVVGSNTANILLILGISAAVRPLYVARGTVWKEIPFLMLASIALVVQTNDFRLNGGATDGISRGDGLILLGFLSIFLYYMVEISGLIRPREEQPPRNAAGLAKPAGLVLLGLAMLVVGGNLTVEGAVRVAQALHVSDKLIGLTIVAIGTSLPELAASAVAAARGKADIAVGNVVGSSILNILFILGASAVAGPLRVAPGLNEDILVMLAATLLLFGAMFVGVPRHQVQRGQGVLFVALYVVYIGFLVWRG